METLIKADIFFFISSVSAIAIFAVVLTILFQISNILTQIRKFLQSITSGTEALAEDLGQVRTKLNERGLLTGLIISIMAAVASKNSKRKAKDD